VATVHLISGLPCSGKTTYSRALQVDLNAVLFILDRWLITAFERYAIADVGYPEHVRRVLACRTLIWDDAAEFLKRGVDVILDDGFFYREHRMRVAEQARRLGAAVRIHHLDAPLDVLESRLADRNAHLPRFNFLIEPETLGSFIEMYERPSADEGAEVVVVRDAAEETGLPHS
jgi:predicted kinase